jgi:integrase/recombinase XerD
MRLEDVRADHVQVVQGKGDKDRLVPIHDEALGWIERYVREARPASALPWLFLQPTGGALSRAVLWKIVAVRGRRAGLVVTPHMLRHTFASHLLDGGADLVAIQAMLGHELLETTAVYTHVAHEQISETYDDLHPRDSMILPSRSAA